MPCLTLHSSHISHTMMLGRYFTNQPRNDPHHCTNADLGLSPTWCAWPLLHRSAHVRTCIATACERSHYKSLLPAVRRPSKVILIASATMARA